MGNVPRGRGGEGGPSPCSRTVRPQTNGSENDAPVQHNAPASPRPSRGLGCDSGETAPPAEVRRTCPQSSGSGQTECCADCRGRVRREHKSHSWSSSSRGGRSRRLPEAVGVRQLRKWVGAWLGPEGEIGLADCRRTTPQGPAACDAKHRPTAPPPPPPRPPAAPALPHTVMRRAPAAVTACLGPNPDPPQALPPLPRPRRCWGDTAATRWQRWDVARGRDEIRDGERMTMAIPQRAAPLRPLATHFRREGTGRENAEQSGGRCPWTGPQTAEK